MTTTIIAMAHHRLGVAHAAATGAAVVLFLLVLRVLFGPMGAGSPTALTIAAL
jgi:hypothetical protein